MAERVVLEGQTLKELEREITCSVCQEHYTEPKVLACLHYYCKECVLNLAFKTASNKPFSCPECREDITLPEEGVEKLKTAFFINRLKSNFFALEKVQGKIELKCEGCNSMKKAVAFCRQCAVFIGSDCVTSHKNMKILSSHEVVSLEDLKKGRAKQIAVKNLPANKCIIHEEPLLLFCFDCNSLICRDCTVTVHREHSFEFTKVASPEIKASLCKELDRISKVSAMLTNAIDLIHTTKCKVEAEREYVAYIIKNSFQEIYDKLENQKSKLLREASRKMEVNIEKLSVQEKNLSLENVKLQSIVENTERFVGHCSDNEVISMHDDIKRQIQREIERHDKLSWSVEPEKEVEVVSIISPDEMAEIWQETPNLSAVVEKEKEEWNKNLCKFRLFAKHPITGMLIEKKMDVHKEKTLRQATQEAYKLIGFTKVIPLDQCRLVRYDEYSETLDQSFDYTEQDESLVHHVDGPRSFYTFELFLETRKPDEKFQVYNKGGLNLKIHVIDLPQETVRDAVQLRGEHGWTVQHFKEVLGKEKDEDDEDSDDDEEDHDNDQKNTEENSDDENDSDKDHIA